MKHSAVGSEPRVARAGAMLVAGLVTITFGAFSWRFGLYYDDYPSWYLHLTAGPWAAVHFLGGQARPLVGLLPWLGGSVTGSHMLMWLVHVLSAWTVFLIVRSLWPAHPTIATLTAALTCVYPLYWLRPAHIAMATDLSLLLALVSLWLCLRSLDLRRWRRAATVAISVALLVAYPLLYELPFGLELLRPVLMGVKARRWGRSLLRAWAPWLVTMVGFLGWRLLIFRPWGDYERLQYNARIVFPDGMALGRLIAVLGDQLVGTWLHQLRHLATDGIEARVLLGAALCMLLALVCHLRLRGSEGGGSLRVLLEMSGIGLAIVVAGQLAALLGGRVSEYTGLSSRWTLVSGIGASLFWAATLLVGASLPRKAWLARVGQGVALAMIGLGGLAHIENARDFIRDWENQRQLFWQLAWRAPGFEPGTLLILDRRYSNAIGRENFEYELTMSADLFFAGDRSVAATTAELAEAAGLAPRRIELTGRSWNADPGQSVLVYAGTGCVEVVGGPLPAGKTLSPAGRSFRRISSQSWIAQSHSPASPYRYLFGPEPPHGWCHYYQQAQLAAQRGDGERVVRLGHDAWSLGLAPDLDSEWDLFREFSRRVQGREFPRQETMPRVRAAGSFR